MRALRPRWPLRRRLVAIGALSVFLTACPSSDAPPRSGGGGTPEPTAVAPEGGITVGMLGEPATLDPYSPRAGDLTRALTTPLYPSLFKLLPDGSTQPYLAENLTEAPGRVRVSLRAMRWSDGSPITAKDVLATWRRARLPSGLAFARRARVAGEDIVFHGTVERWDLALATAAPILPAGRADRTLYGGPFELTGKVPGLKLVLEPNPEWEGEGPLLERVQIEFIDSFDIMMALLSKGHSDVAAVPSSVNLGDRLDELGLEHDQRLGSEEIRLGFRSETITLTERSAVLATIDPRGLSRGLIRDDGRLVANIPSGVEPVLPDTMALAVPEGDELLFLLQRAIELRVAAAGTAMDLLEIEVRRFYPGDPPGADIWLERWAGSPLGSLVDGRDSEPLFRVKTYLVWQPGVEGPEVNPNVTGPLWNLERWTK